MTDKVIHSHQMEGNLNVDFVPVFFYKFIFNFVYFVYVFSGGSWGVFSVRICPHLP